jgi:hypothetical protein
MAEIIIARPWYETQANRDDEERIAEAVRVAWKLDDKHKLDPKKYGLDWQMDRGGSLTHRYAAVWVETKRRYVDPASIRPLILSLHKVMSARWLHQESGLPCYLVVEFNGGVLRYADLLPRRPRRIAWDGRTDRGDPGDMEPCVLIDPWEWKAV